MFVHRQGTDIDFTRFQFGSPAIEINFRHFRFRLSEQIGKINKF